MHLRAAAANLIWGGACLDNWWRFRAALEDPSAAQARLLAACVRRNRHTAFGRAHGFDRIRSIADYRARVPIVGYDEVEPYVARVAAGEPNVLTADRVQRLQPSGGSTSAVKLVPYTTRLQAEISRAVDPWMADLFLRTPRLMGGRAYWAITPPASPPQRSLAVPVGFEDDSQYLGGLRARLVRAVLVTPAAGDLTTAARFRRATLTALLLTPDLRLISVWHPSLLEGLLDALIDDWDDLLEAVARVDPARARALRRLGSCPAASAIWPRLALVSCWTDGPAASAAQTLARRLPGIEVQRKGLMATEGVVTIPFGHHRPLAIRSHIFEFLAPDGSVHLPHDLEPGADYGVVITTSGGLYRYRLGDRVRVDGKVGRTPSLTFVGREDRVSDRFGEKLSDGFVATVIETLFPSPARPRFAMLAPDESATGVAYTLYLDRQSAERDGLSAALERELRRNPHYAWCVDLGQLQPARVAAVGPSADQVYVEACVARGQRLGDVKPVSLDRATGWGGRLAC